MSSGGQMPRPSSRTTSAPTSPLKEKKAGFLGKMTNISQVVSAKVELARDKAEAYRGFNKDKCFCLLVIDDQNTDWSKYFRGKKVHTDHDIRVEQAEFRDLTVSANNESGVTVSILNNKPGNRILKSFKPDFLLIRQNLRDANEDHKSLLLGFQYGGIPSLNSLQSVYNFQDRPWVYAHMVQVQNKLGKDKFPLIDQTYFPNHKEMVGNKYPCVIKVGHAHNGLGKVKCESNNGFQDVASVVAISGSYCTVENYIDAKYDLHIYKIGDNYRAIMRKSLSGAWKTNIGQSILEEIPVTDTYKMWINAVAEMFGGLSICSLEAVVAKDGKEYIIEVNDSATGLLGDSQEEDRRHIAEIILAKMETECQIPDKESVPTVKPGGGGGTPAKGKGDDERPSSAASSVASASTSELGKAKQELKEAIKSKEPVLVAKPKDVPPKKDVKEAPAKPKEPPKLPPAKPKEPPKVVSKAAPPPLPEKPKPKARHDSGDSTASSASDSSSASADSSGSSTVRKDDSEEKDDDEETKEDDKGEDDSKPKDPDAPEGEDTMKNLRKTFAGIFGDLQ